jgi:hypothetical protein
VRGRLEAALLYRRAAFRAWNGSQGVPAPDSGGAVFGADYAWAQMGSAGGLGSGLVRGWVGLGGLRPAKQLRPAREMKGHGQTLVAGPRKRGDGLRVEGVGLRYAQE